MTYAVSKYSNRPCEDEQYTKFLLLHAPEFDSRVKVSFPYNVSWRKLCSDAYIAYACSELKGLDVIWCREVGYLTMDDNISDHIHLVLSQEVWAFSRASTYGLSDYDLEMIFSYIVDFRALAAISSVCKRWKHTASADSLWKEAYRKAFSWPWNGIGMDGPCEWDIWYTNQYNTGLTLSAIARMRWSSHMMCRLKLLYGQRVVPSTGGNGFPIYLGSLFSPTRPVPIRNKVIILGTIETGLARRVHSIIGYLLPESARAPPPVFTPYGYRPILPIPRNDVVVSNKTLCTTIVGGRLTAGQKDAILSCAHVVEHYPTLSLTLSRHGDERLFFVLLELPYATPDIYHSSVRSLFRDEVEGLVLVADGTAAHVGREIRAMVEAVYPRPTMGCCVDAVDFQLEYTCTAPVLLFLNLERDVSADHSQKICDVAMQTLREALPVDHNRLVYIQPFSQRRTNFSAEGLSQDDIKFGFSAGINWLQKSLTERSV
mmetsp:Transcript_16746/g.25146  ORF Transcript_16746/g.25146 Transcript_16746/m.25146 type:complete len:486 (-) Transcript_16746:181-1638(-)|eukprot:CAMPEP_0185035128 /NCGR_PEP_ID=MMETSP1103-20130426/25892_1 /TAXON_ID=36769 /ORGANISM="Paraphysomonas bandaiensis, Strain Caron Lab Isolate" /LENGTH=485 /DNA_ID=CAMNT_0027572063 /DNA_START=31 /DNA_END=1488 /DNA_ORIENTATION=-